MVNQDEKLLLSKRIDLTSSQPIISQVLRIAIYDEFKAYETYDSIIQKFGNTPLFLNIRDAEARHYSQLIPLLKKYSIEIPINDWAKKVEIPNTFIEACEICVADEIENIAMYENLLKHTQELDIKDVLFKLQATSYNNHLPAFRNHVISYYTSNQSQSNVFNQDELIQKLSQYQDLFEELMSGNVDQSKITEIFSKLNISMIGGFVFGGALATFLNNYMENKN